MALMQARANLVEAPVMKPTPVGLVETVSLHALALRDLRKGPDKPASDFHRRRRWQRQRLFGRGVGRRPQAAGTDAAEPDGWRIDPANVARLDPARTRHARVTITRIVHEQPVWPTLNLFERAPLRQHR